MLILAAPTTSSSRATYHHFDPKACQTLTLRLAGALAPGGRLAVHDFVTGSALENPGATMFSLVMLVWTCHGKA
jgi:hypothetical protein